MSGGDAPLKIGKNIIFWRKIVIFHTKYPNIFRAPPPVTWNPGSAPVCVIDMLSSLIIERFWSLECARCVLFLYDILANEF